MVNIHLTTCVTKLKTGKTFLIKCICPDISCKIYIYILKIVTDTRFLSMTFVLLTSSMNPLNHPYLSQCPKDISAERISMFPEQKLKF